MTEENKQGFKRLGIAFLILCIIGGVYTLLHSNNEEEQPKTNTQIEEIFKCNKDYTYMTEYEEHFNRLYYKHSVSGLDWKKIRETKEECQYHTIIKIEDGFGNKEKYDLFITTYLDHENKKEHVKSLIVNNMEVYK